jgi:hypothetical protein
VFWGILKMLKIITGVFPWHKMHPWHLIKLWNQGNGSGEKHVNYCGAVAIYKLSQMYLRVDLFVN